MKSTITEGALFHSAALGETHWTVRSVEGEDALNHEYSFRVRLDLATSTLTQEDLEGVLDAPAALSFIEGERELNRFSGVVESLTTRPDLDHTRTELELTLVPRVALAAHRRGSELFLERTIPEVLFEKLSAWGLREEDDFASLLRSKYFRRELVAQHEESDLAFVRRLCEGSGITTSYEERGGREVLVLSDGNTPFEDIARPRLHARRRADHPAAYDIDTTLRRVPQNVRLHDYNYRTPTLSLLDAERTQRAAAVGDWAEFGEHPKTREDVRALAIKRQEELACKHHTITGSATEAALRAGRVVHIVDSVASEQAVLLTRVHYRFRAATESAAEAQGWENRFEGIPANVAYRPPRVTPVPKIAGLMNAVVDGAIRGDYAELDDMGRYRLQLAHDRSGRTDLGATHPVRMLQPHGGANYGMHFPLRPGTEVLVGFVNGDPDRPAIVGAAPNPAKTSPVAARNQTQNVLRTGSNNELVLEDLKEHERIRIHTPNAATTLQMGSPEEAEEGFLLTTEAHVTTASRRSNNTVTDRQTTIARSSTTVLGERLVMLAGVRGITEAADGAIERPGAASAARIAPGLHRLTYPPIAPGSTSFVERPPMAPIAAPAEAALHSDTLAQAAERSDEAALELVRTMSRAAEAGMAASQGRLQGEPLGEPTEPAAILGSEKLAALIGRANVLVSGDRTATLSAMKSAALVGQESAVVKSAGEVEVAGQRSVHVTSSGVVDVAANTARVVAGYYPEAEAPTLDDGTSLGVMSRRDLRIHSVEDCILLCANKNLIGSAHEGDVRLHAKETVLVQGGSIHGAAGHVGLKSSGDLEVEAGGSIAVKAAADVTIDGATVTISAGVIRLVGSVFVEGDLMCSGNSNLK